MRIAHIESSMHWGGQELRIVEQTEWLNAQGHLAWIIARPGAAIVDKSREKDLPVCEMAIRGAFNPGTLRRLLRFIDHHDIQLLDCHGNRDASYGAYVRWLSGIAVIRSRHIIDPLRRDPFNRLIWRLGNHGVIVTAEAIADHIVSSQLSKRERIYVAEAGVDERRFHPQVDASELRQRLGITPDQIVVANIGMIRPDKGQLEFVEASKQVLENNPLVVCIQIGEATSHSLDYKQQVLEAAGDHLKQQRIRFLGYHDDIEQWLALANIVVIASIATEAKTRLVSQCFLMKKNVVATRVGGLPEMIGHGSTGLLCPANEPSALAQAVQNLIDDPCLAEGLRERAYQQALKTATFGHMMDGMLAVYELALAKTHSR